MQLVFPSCFSAPLQWLAELEATSLPCPQVPQGQLLGRKPGFFATRPQPASAIEHHRLMWAVCHLCNMVSPCGKTEPCWLPCQLCVAGPRRGAAQRHGEEGFVSNNDIIDRLEWDQGCSMSVISRNSLKPSVHYGMEPRFLRLASLPVFNPAPKAFWGNPAKSRLFHPELHAELDPGE